MSNSKKYLQEEIIRTSGVNPKKCMRCGKCSATCPAYDEMEYHPHQFVYMVESGNIEPLLESDSLYRCLTCFACVDRCPRSVDLPVPEGPHTISMCGVIFDLSVIGNSFVRVRNRAGASGCAPHSL